MPDLVAKAEHPYETENQLVLNTEALLFSDGDTVPFETLTPILGESGTKVIEAILPEEGDKIFIRGSTVTMLLAGVLSKNPITGAVPTFAKSDIDIAVATEPQRQALHVLGSTAQTSISTTFTNNEISIGIVSLETLDIANKQALNELTTWVDSLPDSHPRKSYFQERLRTIKSTSQTQEATLQDQLFTTESVYLECTRDASSSIKMVLRDPAQALPVVREGILDALQEHEQPIIELQINSNSVRSLYLEALQYMDNEVFKSRVPFWIVDEIPRLMIMKTELGIHDYSEKLAPYLWEVAYKMFAGQQSFSIEGRDVKAELARNIQGKFARCCANNPTKALEETLEGWPIAAALSPAIGKDFSDYYRIQRITPQEQIGETIDKMQETKAYAALTTAKNLIRKIYGESTVQATTKIDGQTYDMFLKTPKEYPTNMSEVMSILLFSLGWNENSDISQIEGLVENWKPRGVIKETWSMHEQTFDTGLNIGLIVENMKILRNMS